MDSDQQVAVVALVVSLIALLVTLLQLFQQYFATADGYRRCAESVIGVWHKKRHRRFVPSEFRFETTFVTPEILLVTPSELDSLMNQPGLKDKIDLLNHFEVGVNSPLLTETVHPGALKQTGKWWKRISYLLSDGSTKARRLFSAPDSTGSTLHRDAEQGNDKAGERDEQPAHRLQRKESELLVTWIHLLRELHRVYSSYWLENCEVCSPNAGGWQMVDSSTKRVGYLTSSGIAETPNKENDLVSWRGMERTDAAIIYRKWNWDFMPPDVVRPLAKTTVGDLVVLALRMGMEWRTLEPDNGKMQADGNGGTLSALNINGLGIVVRFSMRAHQRVPRVAPSRPCDKMLCGIVPGDPTFVGRDFPMVENGRKVSRLTDSRGILEQIGVSQEHIDYIRTHKEKAEPANDSIVLLCPFIPLQDSTIARICFHGWQGSGGWRSSLRPTPWSLFFYWESRLALLRTLRKKLESETVGSELQEVLIKIHYHLAHLEETYPADFYCQNNKRAILNLQGGDGKVKEELITSCRKAFIESSEILRTSPGSFQSSVGDDSVPRPYLHLVAAHACMSARAMTAAQEKVKREKGQHSRETLRDKYNVVNSHDKEYGPWFVQEYFEMMCACLELVHDKKNGIGAYLAEKGVRLEENDVDVAWWALMLRGIAWSMSVWTNHPPGDPIPSSMYANQTPVWLA